MARLTQKLNYSLKKKTLYAAEKESEKVQKERFEFWSKLRDIRVEDLIFVDESGVNLAMVRLYARALKGKRTRGKKPLNRGRNVSLISALSFKEVLASAYIYGAVDGATLKLFWFKN